MPTPQKKPLTKQDVRQAALTAAPPNDYNNATARVHRIEAEISRGFDFLEGLPKTVTFFGSTKTNPDSRNYQNARALAKYLVTDHKFGVVTGGGPGIMEAANRGAAEANGVSAGLTIQLPTGQKSNPYLNHSCDFHYFFTRKLILSFAARMYIFFPGGYGTLDEFFEIVTLVQTNKIQAIPIVCFGAEFWAPLQKWLNDYLLIQNEAIAEGDLGLFTITDSMEMVGEIASYAEARV